MSDNPNEAIREVEELRENLSKNQIDLLGYDQFSNGEERLKKAVNGFNPSTVLVEGHTDSTGRSSNNHILSVKRSESVAKYLKSLNGKYNITSQGFGESKPIANNETRKGRALNRRVDIIVNTSNKL